MTAAEIAHMIPDLDIYRSANLLVKQHSEDAPIHASMRADAMLEAGERAVEELWSEERPKIATLQFSPKATSFVGNRKSSDSRSPKNEGFRRGP